MKLSRWHFTLITLLLSTSCTDQSDHASSVKGNCIQSMSGKKADFTYEDLFNFTVTVARAQQISSFTDIDKIFAASRQNIAKYLDPQNAFDFGKTRNPDFALYPQRERKAYVTRFSEDGAYSGAVARLKLIFEGKIEGNYGLQDIGSLGDYQLFEISAKNPIDPDGEDFILTQYTGRINENGALVSMKTGPSEALPTDTLSYIDAIHTPNAALTQLHSILEALFERALKEDTAENIWKNIGTFHWWYANAMPYKRGSASISKMHVAYLLQHHENTLGIFNINRLHHFPKVHSIDIDVLAMTLGDPDIFASHYKDAIMTDMALEGTPMAVP